MTNNKINILFLLSKSRINKAGFAPLYCRITYLGKRKIFSTGLFSLPSNWNNLKQQVHPPNDENTIINSQLSLIKNKINQAFLFLQLQGFDFTVEHIFNQYAGVAQNEDKSLMEAVKYHNNKMKRLIGIETTFTSWEKYNQTEKHLSDFLWFKFKKKDILLKELNLGFINEYEYFLKTEKKFMQSTIFKSIERFRKMINMSVAMDYLSKDPFLLYKTKRPRKEIIFLNSNELKAIENHSFASKRLQDVADMFIFCCYTGLAYQEMANLKGENIVKYQDNSIWIEMNRQKTGKRFVIPLLKKAINIIEKHRNKSSLLPIISNQKFNAYLKEIADILGINKKLTHHIARKTFATTVLLENDVPIEIVSELLGHSDIAMTKDHYAVVLKSKLKEHIDKVSKKLK